MLSLPQNFESFNEARKKSFMALYHAKEQGKKIIGTFCSYTPVEIINAKILKECSITNSAEAHALAFVTTIFVSPRNSTLLESTMRISVLNFNA